MPRQSPALGSSRGGRLTALLWHALLVLVVGVTACGSSGPPTSLAPTVGAVPAATTIPAAPSLAATTVPTMPATPSPTATTAPTLPPATATARPPTQVFAPATMPPTGAPARTPIQAAATAPLVTIDPAVAYQTMMGFGSSERLWDDPHVVEAFDPATQRGLKVTTAQEDELLDLLYRDLGLTRVRATLEGGVEPHNDNADPNSADPARFNFAWKRLDGHVDYVRRAQARGLTTPWFSPITLEPWMRRDQPAEVAEWLLVALRRWRALGVELPYIAVINEPGYERSGYWSGEELRAIIKILGPRLRAEGFATTVVITDDLNASEAYKRCVIILADDQARQYVGALAYHLYGGDAGDRKRMADLGARYNLPIWMSEYAEPANALTWAAIIHDLIANGNVSAVDAQWGFFGQWDRLEARLITLRNDGTRYLGYDLTKMYYMTGQYSRFVRPGMQRVRVEDMGSGVKITAFREGSRLVLVAVNDGAQEQSATVRLAGDRPLGRVTAVRTSATENWADLPTPQATGGQFALAFPAGSVTTLTIDAGASAQCFPQTGKCVGERFFAHWQENGGLAINGYPISDEMVETLEDGQAYTVQYFERVRLELHPENAPPYDVLLGQFGRYLYPADPPAPALPDRIYFPETGHNVGERFWAYWQGNGGLQQFGYPISEEFPEQLEDGQSYLVQYFERARFEYHSQNAPPYDVLLGQFGRRILQERNP